METKRGSFGVWFFRSLFVVLFFLPVSLSWMAANVEAAGSVEISSPEESIESSLSGPGLPPPAALPPQSLPTMLPAIGSYQKGAESLASPAVPFIPGGAFAYQVDPVSAMISAAVVLGVQSLREQGRVDLEAIGALLNNTDFYAGVVGSVSAALARKGIAVGGQRLMAKFSTRALDTASRGQAMRFLSNFANGISYTLAVGAGYEYFSQFWKLSIEGVDGVQKVSDLKNLKLESFLAVLNNLMKYAVMPDFQKRIMSSVFNHRIMTFEFIAMNVAMYLGIVTGALVAERMGGKLDPGTKKTTARVLTEYFSKVSGGILFGVVIQFIPDGFRLAVNRQLLGIKLGWARSSLSSTLDEIESGIRLHRYPPRPNRSLTSEISRGESLPADLDRVFRARDLYLSLQIQRVMATKDSEQVATELASVQQEVSEHFSLFYQMSGGRNPLKDPDETDAHLSPKNSEESLGVHLHRDLFQDEYQKYYSTVIEIALLRLEQTQKSFKEFFEMTQLLPTFQN